jgi:hypothetical protein
VGLGTDIEVVGVSQNNPVYQVLLCQGFHHITGGHVHPVMGRLVYHVNMLNGKDSSILATLKGVQVQGPSRSRVAQVTVAAEDQAGEGTPRKNIYSTHTSEVATGRLEKANPSDKRGGCKRGDTPQH